MKLEFKNLATGVMFLHPNGKTYRKAGRSLKAGNDSALRSHTNLQLMVVPLYNVPVQCYSRFHSRNPVLKYVNEQGVYHREDGPAVSEANGHKEWYLNGHRHREDGPAVEHASGGKEWYQHNKLHRLDGPASSHDANAYYIAGIRYYDNFEFQVAAEHFKQQLLTTQ